MELRWGDSLAVWWSFFWRAGLIGAGLGFVAGLLAGIVATFAGGNSAIWGGVAGWVVSIPASMLALKLALSKHLDRLGKIANEVSI